MDCLSNCAATEFLFQNKIASLTLLIIYILIGSDYVSGFYGKTHKSILTTFLKYSKGISTDEDPLAQLDVNDEHNFFRGISFTAYARLMSLLYI